MQPGAWQTELTQQEDIQVSEWVQQGLGSSTYDRAPYAGPEVAVHHFHRLLARDLRAAVGLDPGEDVCGIPA